MGKIVVVVGKEKIFFEGKLNVIDSSNMRMSDNKLLIIKDMDNGKNIGVFQKWDHWRKVPSEEETVISPADRCPYCAGEYKLFPAVNMLGEELYTGCLDILVYGGEVRSYEIWECEECGHLKFRREAE